MEGCGHDLQQHLPSTTWVVLLTHKHSCLLTTNFQSIPADHTVKTMSRPFHRV